MTVSVRYYCPRCGAIATLERDAYLADKSVTPYPLEGWTYAAPEEGFEDADGVRLTCGEHTGRNDIGGTGEGVTAVSDESGDADPPCGEVFYLNFVRFEDDAGGDGREEGTGEDDDDGDNPYRVD